jgi:hypothetical protein
VTDTSRVTQADRAWQQQRAAAELSSILHQHPDLPCIGWTVGPAGSVLAGHVNGLAPAAQVRAVFDAWRHVLVLEGYREHQGGGGTAFLHAAARRNQVKIRLTATVFGDEPEAGQ